MLLKLIKINTTGSLVGGWQYFLRGLAFYQGEVSEIFDEETLRATINFQRANNLQPDGVVGNKTYGVAMTLGFEGISDDSKERTSMNWPLKPRFSPLIGNDARAAVFGRFSFVHAPLPGNRENIRITGNWQTNNIQLFHIPQLIKIKGSDKVWFHKMAGAQLIKLWADWDAANLMHMVLTWDGGFVPRFVRGSAATLSNHAFGSAFDINAAWNGLGIVPPLIAQKGCVRELVQIANANGFYWGGHFNRKDGMHFEIAKLM